MNINEQDLLRYGEILTDDKFCEENEYEDKFGVICYGNLLTRIRTIAHNNHVYYMKMVNGEVIEVKELV